MIKINILTPGFETQNGAAFLFPLIFFRKPISDSGIKITFYSKFTKKIFNADIIGVDSKFHKFFWKENKRLIFEQFRQLKKETNKLIYFDTTDSTGSLQTDLLPYVDIYCKGQILKDKKKYQKRFYGGRVFTDFVHKKINVLDNNPEFSMKVDDEKLLEKICISWNSALSDYSVFGPFLIKLYNILPIKMLLSLRSVNSKKKNKIVHCRFGSHYSRKTVTWQRNKIISLLKKNNLERVSRLRFFNELLTSKIVISPFGWGEICLRDFETFLCNSLLFKPDMEHINTWPNLYIKNKTYIPFSWDLNDFLEKLENLKENFDDYIDVANFGRTNYLKYASLDGANYFLDHLKKIIKI